MSPFQFAYVTLHINALEISSLTPLDGLSVVGLHYGWVQFGDVYAADYRIIKLAEEIRIIRRGRQQ